MKKLMSTLAVATMLVIGAGQAHAALLTDWDYVLEKVYFKEHNTDLVDENTGDTGFSWTGGKYSSSMTPSDKVNVPGEFTFSKDSSTAVIKPEDASNQSTELGTPNADFKQQNLATLSFDYTITSAGGEVSFDITYNIPLQIYYDSTTGNEYIFYSANDVYTQGLTGDSHDNYDYGVTGISLRVDDNATSKFTIDGKEYIGWVINEETRKYFFEDAYDPTGTNDILREKDMSEAGKFDIDASLTVTYTQTGPDPAPTPEPATMLLMGLGLAGLGFVARRRNQK